MRRSGAVLLALSCLALAAGCQKPRNYKTTVELTRVHPFGRDPKEPSSIDIEMRFSECPGEAKKLVRGDKAFARCGVQYHTGDKLPVELVQNYDSERGQYRSEVTRVGDCDIKVDTKDEANFETVENCTELKASGNTVGVNCSRRRDKALVDKCPWLRRN